MKSEVKTTDIKNFWEKNPVCAKDNPHAIGTPDYFTYFDKLRDKIEPPVFADRFYEFSSSRGKTVLDVGCGNGWVLSHFARHGAVTVGVDITEAGVELCRTRFKNQKLKGDFVVGNAEALPFPDNSFDVVSCMGVVHHTSNPQKAVSELFRVLKPGGRLLFMIYHRNSVLYRFKFPLLKLLTGKSIQQLVNEVDGFGNPRGDVYSKAELKKMLNEFTITEMSPGLIEGWMVLPYVGRFLPDVIFKPFEKVGGWFLYAKGTKR
jgi:ubiquinone/menaquinone biosynthesis C-methylase UbiE